jgi:hypothetical protein
VSAGIGARLYPFQVQLETRERQLAHFDCEPRRLREPGLFEGGVTPESGLNREALAPLDAVDHEPLVLAIHLVTDLSGDAGVRSAIQGSRSIIGVVESYAKARYRKRGRLAAAGRTGNNKSSWDALAAEAAACVLLHSGRHVLPGAPSLSIDNPLRLELANSRSNALDCSGIMRILGWRLVSLGDFYGSHYFKLTSGFAKCILIQPRSAIAAV